MQKFSKLLSILLCLSMLLGMFPNLARAAEVPKTYTFSDYTAGTQYAEDEEHVLDDMTTVITTQCHFTTQLRIYSSSSHDGYAIIRFAEPITKISLNLGNKEDTLNVYGSTDGENWTKVGGITTTTTEYSDYVLEMGAGTAYTYLKLDVEGTNQIRVASMTIYYEGQCDHSYVVTDLGDGTHIKKCACGATEGTAEEHSDIYFVYSNHSTHNAVCVDCDAVLLAEDHNYFDDGTCSCGYLEHVTAPVVDTGYKLGVYQGNLEKGLYFTGNTANKDYYLETTETLSDGIVVYLETVEGGYHIYFMNGDVKTYIDIYVNGTYINLRLTDAPTAVFVWNSDYNTFTTDVGEDPVTYYIGTYNTYNTLSASKFDFISSSFPVHLYELPPCTHPNTTTKYEISDARMHIYEEVCDDCGETVGNGSVDYHEDWDGSCPCGITSVSIADALAGETDEYFCVRGQVTFIDGRNIYIQDATGGINIYLRSASNIIEVGDDFVAYGKRGAYNGLQQLSNGTFAIISPSDRTYDDPVTVTLAELDDTYLCEKVIIKNLTVVAVNGNNVTVTDDNGTTAINIYKGTYSLENVYVGDTIASFSGVVGTYNGLQLRSSDTIAVTPHPCKDTDSDHKCDTCLVEVSQCADANKDHKCDTCSAAMGTHEAAAGKHTCDYCNQTVTQCADANKDHKCDVCGKTVSECVDTDADYKCDICGADHGTPPTPDPEPEPEPEPTPNPEPQPDEERDLMDSISDLGNTIEETAEVLVETVEAVVEVAEAVAEVAEVVAEAAEVVVESAPQIVEVVTVVVDFSQMIISLLNELIP